MHGSLAAYRAGPPAESIKECRTHPKGLVKQTEIHRASQTDGVQEGCCLEILCCALEGKVGGLVCAQPHSGVDELSAAVPDRFFRWTPEKGIQIISTCGDDVCARLCRKSLEISSSKQACMRDIILCSWLDALECNQACSMKACKNVSLCSLGPTQAVCCTGWRAGRQPCMHGHRHNLISLM